MSKTIIVSNRLPVKVSTENNTINLQVSEGGLATGLGSIYKSGDNVWIGWPGMDIHVNDQPEVSKLLKEENLYPVYLNEEEILNYYEGFSNEVLWPICHYMATYAQFDEIYWDYYKKVNEKFRDEILKVAKPGDTVWIHDYQLLLLPRLIRKELANISIAFFQHIPFPSFEIFRLIPWRTELIAGMLGADLIGFHTYDDVRHYISSASHLLHLSGQGNKIINKGREIIVDAFPMGIDAKKFQNLAHSNEVQQQYRKLEPMFQDTKVILSIDRLDYSKGILQRLNAIEMILEKHPEYIEKMVLIMVVVPSRDTIPQYKELKDEIDKLVGNINANFRTPAWHPIHYFYRSFPIESLSAFYSRADICLVTPMRDGMNLVSKEYIASRRNPDGVLILSEMAGASKELTDALIINPNNLCEVYQSIIQALEMPIEEQRVRMQALSSTVNKFDIHHWVKIFMSQLHQIKDAQKMNETRAVNPRITEQIVNQLKVADKRVFFLDYDGTLVGFNTEIDKALPDPELYELLKKLTKEKKNKVVIISGRKHETLEKWFGDFPVDMIAEHGAWKRIYGEKWEVIPGLSDSWKEIVRPMLESYSDRTPGSFIEEKNYSLAWHYRKVGKELGEQRAGELSNNLVYLTRETGLQILPGNKVLEIKNVEVNKGKSALDYLNGKGFDFILAIGDDHTDEDIFTSLPDGATSIKVGSRLTAADYYVKNVEDVRLLLENFIE